MARRRTGAARFATSTARWEKRLKRSMRQRHFAGEKLFVDYAGRTIPIYGRGGKESFHAQLFVSAMGASGLAYAEATRTQQLPDWLASHVRALAFYGAAPTILVPDNLRVGVTRADRYEPDLQRSYEELAGHYGALLIPARPYRPKDKSRVELTVLLVCRWILARRIVQAGAPCRPIERGLATPALLAQVIAAKYADHCPLYRQEGIYRRSGVELPRAMLADWVGQSAALLDPLVSALQHYVMQATKLHADDTPVPVLEPGKGRCRTPRLWAYVRDDRPAAGLDPPAVLYRYSPDRKGEHPEAHLSSFRGTLQADGYAGFNGLYERAEHPLREAACWAHARRKYYDVYVADQSATALEAIHRIGELYGIERDIRGQTPAHRQQIRQQRAAPRLAQLRTWLCAQLVRLSVKSPLAAAIQYTLTRWEELNRYVEDGAIEIDNNAAERAIRALVLGRRNYLFAGSDGGGETAARLYSLIGTCRLNGIDPHLYLRHVLERVAEHPVNRIEELLPWHLAPSLPKTLAQAA